MDVTTEPERLQRPTVRGAQDALADRARQLAGVCVCRVVGVEEVEQDGEAEHGLGGAALQADHPPARIPSRAQSRRQD